MMQSRGSPRHRSLFSCSSSRPRYSGHHSGPQRHDYHGAARALSPPSARRARQGRSLTPPPREGLIPGAQRLPPKGHRQVEVSRVVRSRSRRGERAEKAQDLDEAPITMDYQSEFARIKEERRRLKELERTLRAELKDVAKRAPDEKLLFGKPLRALEGGKAAGRRDRSRSLGRSSSRSVFRGARFGGRRPQPLQARGMGGPERGGPHRSAAPAHGRRPWPRREAAELGHHVHPQWSRAATSCKSFRPASRASGDGIRGSSSRWRKPWTAWRRGTTAALRTS